MRQLQIPLEDRSLLEEFPEFRDVIRASVYGCGRQMKAIAADLDLSPSELSRMLADNPNDPRNFPVGRLPELIAATRDKRPALWLVERFLDDPGARRQHAMDRIDALLPELQALVREARSAPERGEPTEPKTLRSIR